MSELKKVSAPPILPPDGACLGLAGAADHVVDVPDGERPL
jgi:hypothetical protein